MALSSSKAYDFDTDAICSNVKTFEGRLLKIQNLITTIQQVSAVHVISTLQQDRFLTTALFSSHLWRTPVSQI